MMIEKQVIDDTGFRDDSWQFFSMLTLDDLNKGRTITRFDKAVLYLENNQKIDKCLPYLKQLKRISIAFPDASGGRGFSLARLLRLHGYRGTLGAEGHILADQYRHARQSGFDEVAIPQNLAKRMGQKYWLEQVSRLAFSYQDRIFHRPLALGEEKPPIGNQ